MFNISVLYKPPNSARHMHMHGHYLCDKSTGSATLKLNKSQKTKRLHLQSIKMDVQDQQM